MKETKGTEKSPSICRTDFLFFCRLSSPRLLCPRFCAEVFRILIPILMYKNTITSNGSKKNTKEDNSYSMEGISSIPQKAEEATSL